MVYATIQIMKEEKKDFDIILFYKYVEIIDPIALMREQKILCDKLGLKGRVLIATEGINATLEGTVSNIDTYIETLRTSEYFKDVHIKRSKGTGNAFPKLSVKVRKEIVTTGLPKEEDIDPNKVTGKKLKAEELRAWFEENKDFCIVDMRNDYEFESGHFEGSIPSGMEYFRDLPKVVHGLNHLKDKTVLTVCTGGVRCEKASGYLVKQGFEDVYQLDGGIVTYMEKYPSKDFLGSLYVFDGRLTMNFDTPETHKVVGKCSKCGNLSENYINCANLSCHAHVICCAGCLNEKGLGYCSKTCEPK